MPHWTAEREKRVQGVLCEEMRRLGEIEIALLFENSKIDNVLADGDADTGRTVTRLENSEGKVLERKMRIRRNVDEATQRRTHYLDLTTKRTKATKKVSNSEATIFYLPSSSWCPSWSLREDSRRANLRAARRSYSSRTKLRIYGDPSAV